MKVTIIETIIRASNGIRRRIRNFYYKNVFNSCGSGLQIDNGVQIINPKKISVGKCTRINKGVIIQGTEGGEITLGDNVTISYSAKIITANLILRERRHVYSDVIIGNNVWLCANVIVLPGVKIEDNVIVAAGAVVTSDLASGYIYGGIPAKKIKTI